MPAGENVLPCYLGKAEWRPRDLARAVNEWLVSRGRDRERIHPTTPYSWVKQGFCPYPPYSQIVADVLSAKLGEAIRPSDLWPGRILPAGPLLSADDGLTCEWNTDDVMHLTMELIGQDQIRCSRVSGLRLIGAALDGLHGHPLLSNGSASGERIQQPLVALIVRHIADLRRLDDKTGGGVVSLRYIASELRTVLDLLRSGNCESAVHDRLLMAAADLAQLAGWMYSDAGDFGVGQRFLFLAIRTVRPATESSDRDLRSLATESTANMLGMLAYQAAHAGQPADAVRLAEAATTAARSARPVTQARLAGRRATAYAAAGDIHAFREAAEQAQRLLTGRGSDDPSFLYYLNPDQLAAEAGQALVHLAARNERDRHQLVTEAIGLLTPLASTGLREDYQRSALLHTCYLIEAHLYEHDLESAVAVTRAALQRLPEVQSVRCRSLLRRLRSAFARRARNPYVADLLPDLDVVLSTA